MSDFAGCVRAGIQIAYPSIDDEGRLKALIVYLVNRRDERPNDREWEDYLICRAMGWNRENEAEDGTFKLGSK